MVIFQAVSWEAFDIPQGRYEVCIFGRNQDGKSICARTHFPPYFFIKKTKREIPDKIFLSRVKERLEDALTNDIDTYSSIVKGLSLVRKKDLMFFQNSLEHVFVKIDFKSLGSMKKCERQCHRLFRDAVYEANIEPFLRLMHRTGIKSTGWLEVQGDELSNKISTCDQEFWVPKWTDLKPVDRDDIAPFKIVSFDIETNSSTGKFPDPYVEGDAIFQIALTTRCYGSQDVIDKVCLCYKQTDGDDVVSYDTEADLLLAFRNKIIELDPDVLTGYNIFGFDLDFIWNRGRMCFRNPEHKFYYMGRLKDHECVQTTKKLSSGALGDNVLKLLPMKGRYIFDLFHEIKREKKLDSYSLNNVSKLFLGDQKIDMPAHEMFKRFREGDPAKLGEVADYCIKDTMLPHRLIDKLCIFTNLVEMAKATWVPLSFLSERAQQIKVFSQITRKARELGFLVPTIKVDRNKVSDDKYEGATVLEAHKGAYYTPITALDFASLYPSIMMAHNMCFSTLVLPGSKFDEIDGVEYEEFEAGGKKYRFAQNVPSLLPVILNELKQFRKKAKKLMAQTRGTPMEEVYNGQQLAYKISMNSIYGFCGAKLGMLPCVPIAASVTSQGRNMINMTKERVESRFPGAVVRYGDSVTGDTPVITSDGLVEIQKMANKWFQMDGGKEYCDINTNVWTETGWSRVYRVIRHKTNKNIFRVNCHSGVVDCTEDHSLLKPCGNPVKPGEVCIGQSLLVCKTPCVENVDTMSSDEAMIYGFFYGDGSCGAYDTKWGIKYSWALNNSDEKIINKYADALRNIGYEPMVYDTMKSSGVYKINIKNPSKITKLYRKQFYNSGKLKKVPQQILNGSKRIKMAFLEGLYDADGCKEHGHSSGFRIDTKGKIGAMGIYWLFDSLGYNVSVNTRNDKLQIYRISASRNSMRKSADSIKKIELLGNTNDYVYDLTTDNHHFHAGVGGMIVHNTDSVMVEFPCAGMSQEDAIKHSWKLGEEAAEICNDMFKKPNDLELEKVYCPYILYSKKRYAAKMWTQNNAGEMEMEKIDVKGLQLVRRDNTPYTRDVSKEVLDKILESNDPEPAITLAMVRARELLNGQVTINRLIMSKSLSDEYKTKPHCRECLSPMDEGCGCNKGFMDKWKYSRMMNEEPQPIPAQPHVHVIEKMNARNPGSHPHTGDRVPFVLVKTEDPKAKMFERAEDPKYVEENELELDYMYYFTNQLKKPIEDLLDPLIAGRDIFRDFIPPKPLRKKPVPKCKNIMDMFKDYEQKNSK